MESTNDDDDKINLTGQQLFDDSYDDHLGTNLNEEVCLDAATKNVADTARAECTMPFVALLFAVNSQISVGEEKKLLLSTTPILFP